MAKSTFWYSISNNGDGSASIHWMESKELAEWDQDSMDEGWGEPCLGNIEVEGDNVRLIEDIETKESYLLELFSSIEYSPEDKNKLKKFKKDFFPKGLPDFSVDILDNKNYGIYANGKLVAKDYAYPEKDTNETGLKRVREKLSKLK